MTKFNDILNLYNFNISQQEGLLKALELVGFNLIDTSSSLQDSLNIFNDRLQSTFLRPSDSERQQLSDKFKDEELRTQLIPLLSPFISEIDSGKNVAHKLLLGAAEETVRKRLDTLVKLYNNNNLTQIIYPLGGERELWAIHEPSTAALVAERLAIAQNLNPSDAKNQVDNKLVEIFTKAIEIKNNLASYTDKEFTAETNKARTESIRHFSELGVIWPTESDMIAALLSEYKDKLAGIEIKPVINAEKKLNSAGQWVRPDTLDTLNKMWELYEADLLASNGSSDNLAASIITNQPYGYYQQQHALTAFRGKPIDVKTVASAVDPSEVNFSVLFDSLARTIYAGKNNALEKINAIKANPEKSFVQRYLDSTSASLPGERSI